MGIGVGLAAALAQTTAALGIVLLPLLAVLLMRPEWLPSVLMATVFGEAVATGSVTLSRIGGPLAILVMIVALPERSRVRVPRVGVLLAAGAYGAWALASVLWTVNPDSSFQQGGTGYALASLSLSLVYAVAMVMFLRTERDLKRLMWVTWALSSITGLISVIQYFSGYTRALGLSGDANLFAALQVVVLPVGALLAIQAPTRRLRILVFLGVSIGVGSIMTSLSRGGILALAAVFLMLSYQPAKGFFRTRARKRAFISFVAIGAGILLAASFNALSARASSLFVQNDGGSGRTNLWQAALTGWHEHEIDGLGFGAFIGQSNALLLETPGVSFNDYRLRTTGQVVHNAYLESLVELGVIGAALFLALLVSTVKSLRSTQRDASRAGRWFVSAFARALLLSLCGFAFTSLFLSTETDRTLWTLVGLSVALPRVLAEERRRSEIASAAGDQGRQESPPTDFTMTPGVAT
jgi:O-antigen ligase